MDFREPKLLRRMMELSGYRYTGRQAVNDIEVYNDLNKDKKYPPTVEEDWNALTPNELLIGRDTYYWFKASLTIPTLNSGEKFVVLLDFTKFIAGRIRELEGFEAFTFINGRPFQGMDQNHKELFLDESYSDKTIEFSFMLWTGLEAGGPVQKIEHRLNDFSTAVLSYVTDDLYFNVKLLYKAAMDLDKKSPERELFLQILDETFLVIDWTEPGSSGFYSSVERANKIITDHLESFESNPITKVTGIGHTHIDVAWLWQLKHTREKSARSFSTVLRLMEQYPEYTFLQSQPQLYEFIKEDYPELYEQMKERIKEGRWEADGAMWIEPDCNVPSGESLVRQLIYGASFFKNEFNKDIHYLWLPDVFGYSWALPQILKKSGIEVLMTTKLSWNQYNRMPNDTFIWRGIDGSEIYTHFITTPNPNSADETIGAVYSGLMEPATVKGIYRNYQNKSLNKDLLLAYGHGDGGGGTDREMVEMMTRMKQYTIPTLPKVETGTAKEYFNTLKETIDSASPNEVSTWDGELYLEYHRGTYTSQGRVKKDNRKLELDYRDSELIASTLEMNQNIEYPAGILDEGWKLILKNQFHDILPGCSINEVYQDNLVEYKRAFDISNSIINRLSSVKESESEWTVYNTASWERSEIIDLPILLTEDMSVINQRGESLESIAINGRTSVLVNDIPAFGSVKLSLKKESLSSDNSRSFNFKDHGVETPFYSILWNEKGQLISIFDKKQSREVLKDLGNKIELFEDKPLSYDAWDIDIFYQEKATEVVADTVEIIDQNNLFSKIRFTYNFGKSSMQQDMILYRDDRRIDFVTNLDWQERQQVLKAGFDVDVRSVEATYDIQFGNVKRPTHWNTSWDKARFESIGHQWVDLSETGYGVSLLNDSKYGHDIKNSTIRLTLVTGTIDPDPQADLGKHQFTYSLLPHKGSFLEAQTAEKAWEINHASRVYQGVLTGIEPIIEVESEETVFVDAIKKAQNGSGYVVRFHDHTGGRRNFKLKITSKVKKWIETNLLEAYEGDLEDIQGGTIEMTLDPFEIKTILLK
ncbi:alpha-mannosidase [Marinilactibacillus sp. XAAS-LB27]|uniref:alpha-mannosidase n=1 Tax=Marinilactibacillus sp. XAAS-LB27 TaxID=3114538 RepID=UPI002E195CB1|nr:alpha-mannosidase [Marinilactibacillus sp. XAAS-LB27]